MQFDWSVENGLFRLKPKSVLSYAVGKRLFSTQRFSTGNSDWRIQSKNSTFSTGSSKKTQSKKFYTCCLKRSHRSSHHQTHIHTATRPHTHTKNHTAVSYKALTLAWLSQPLLLAASQRGAIPVLLASSVHYTTAAARSLDSMLLTTAAAAVALRLSAECNSTNVAFGGFRLSPKPPTRWDEGSPSRCSPRKREAQSCQPVSTAVQQYSLTPTSSMKRTKK